MAFIFEFFSGKMAMKSKIWEALSPKTFWKLTKIKMEFLLPNSEGYLIENFRGVGILLMHVFERGELFGRFQFLECTF